jgi:uncharacterized protein (DUF39 family)
MFKGVFMVEISAETLNTPINCYPKTTFQQRVAILQSSSRMIESYLCARDRFLKPGGKMFPNAGTLCTLASRQTLNDFAIL